MWWYIYIYMHQYTIEEHIWWVTRQGGLWPLQNIVKWCILNHNVWSEYNLIRVVTWGRKGFSFFLIDYEFSIIDYHNNFIIGQSSTGSPSLLLRLWGSVCLWGRPFSSLYNGAYNSVNPSYYTINTSTYLCISFY